MADTAKIPADALRRVMEEEMLGLQEAQRKEAARSARLWAHLVSPSLPRFRPQRLRANARYRVERVRVRLARWVDPYEEQD